MIVRQHKWDSCGKYGVDMAVSMISMVGWLSQYIKKDVPNPMSPNKVKQGLKQINFNGR